MCEETKQQNNFHTFRGACQKDNDYKCIMSLHKVNMTYRPFAWKCISIEKSLISFLKALATDLDLSRDNLQKTASSLQLRKWFLFFLFFLKKSTSKLAADVNYLRLCVHRGHLCTQNLTSMAKPIFYNVIGKCFSTLWCGPFVWGRQGRHSCHSFTINCFKRPFYWLFTLHEDKCGHCFIYSCLWKFLNSKTCHTLVRDD